MSHQTLPYEILQTLRCCFCEEYLSVPPIYIYPSGVEVACGRCPLISESNPIRNIVYETVAYHTLFPCKNYSHGCNEMVEFSQMALHEETCPYRPCFCPLAPLATCPWQGSYTELFDHYSEEHHRLSLNYPEFELDVNQISEANYLLKREEDLFLIQIKADEERQIFWLTVKLLGSQEKSSLQYELELKSLDNLEKHTFQSQPVESDASMRLYEETATKIIKADLKIDLEESVLPLVKFSLRFFQEETSRNLTLHSDSPIFLKILASDEDMLRELECPVCNEYMQPPIHQCLSGHSVCPKCKNQISECPVCRGPIKNTRNYALESLSPLIGFRCKYKEFDCPFIGNLEKKMTHELECQYGPYHCPLMGPLVCNWQGRLTDILQHLRSNHSGYISNGDAGLFSMEFTDEKIICKCYITQASQKLFKMVLKYDSMKLFLSVQFIGPSENANEFLYDLDIIDNSQGGRKLNLKAPCTSLTCHEDIFNSPEKFTCLPFHLVAPLVGDKELLFKFFVHHRLDLKQKREFHVLQPYRL